MTESLIAAAPAVNETMEGLAGSHILRIAYEVQALTAAGTRIANFTIGDFDTATFRIPPELEAGIQKAYQAGHTNYPQAAGVPPLRQAIADYYRHYLNTDFKAEEVIVAGGVRPTIYALYLTVVNRGESVVYGIPCWNTKAYVVLSGADDIALPTLPENNFLLTADEIRPHLASAAVVALCSPCNPTGTMFGAEQLTGICEAVLEENRRRIPLGLKPVYLLYDMVYWQYTSAERPHIHPLALVPELKPYTVYTDGMSKTFGATGIRVGWAAGPKNLMAKISDLIGFIGAWPPKPEQFACAEYLTDFPAHERYLSRTKEIAFRRMKLISNMISEMKSDGLPVSCIAPQGGLFMSLHLPLLGKTTPDGTVLNSAETARKYILHEGKTAFVPFEAFDHPNSPEWFRASVSCLSDEDIVYGLTELKAALRKLM